MTEGIDGAIYEHLEKQNESLEAELSALRALVERPVTIDLKGLSRVELSLNHIQTQLGNISTNVAFQTAALNNVNTSLTRIAAALESKPAPAAPKQTVSTPSRLALGATAAGNLSACACDGTFTDGAKLNGTTKSPGVHVYTKGYCPPNGRVIP